MSLQAEACLPVGGRSRLPRAHAHPTCIPCLACFCCCRHPAPSQVVVFTASLGKYADPLLDLLDKAGVVRWRLFREACYPYEGAWGAAGGLMGACRAGAASRPKWRRGPSVHL